MTATARCNHRVLWYVVCPWCEAEANEAMYARVHPVGHHRFVFWRNLTPEQAAREAEREAKLVAVQQLMDRALEKWSDW